MIDRRYQIERNRLFDIPGLNLAGKLEKMNEIQIESYWKTLNTFTESLPKIEEELKNALTAKNYIAFHSHIVNMRDMLNQIYATDYAKDCQAQIQELVNANHEKLEAKLTNLLVNVSTLSIDIQMGQLKRQKFGEDAQPYIYEKQADVQKSILAVDDQSISLSTLKSFLKDTPYKLTCTASGEDALNFLRNNYPDLFILDIMMPAMDGYELAEKIRKSGQKAPIIFLTGNATRDSVLKAILAGGVDFIVKPANKEQVLRRISRLI
jgi:CheY-like chemotaxis protein